MGNKQKKPLPFGRLCCAGDCGRTVIKKHAALAGLVFGNTEEIRCGR